MSRKNGAIMAEERASSVYTPVHTSAEYKACACCPYSDCKYINVTSCEHYTEKIKELREVKRNG